MRACDLARRIEGEDDPNEAFAAVVGERDTVVGRNDVVELDRGQLRQPLDPVLPQSGPADDDLLPIAGAFDACLVIVEIKERVDFRGAIGIEPIDGDGHRIKTIRHSISSPGNAHPPRAPL